MDSEITRLKLSNGLLVLLKEFHTAPIVSQWLWYRVGSRNETPGLTGISHWVEHMQFKGTSRFAPGTLDRAVSRLGGGWNAYTFFDWTAYTETLPADECELALVIESDRMIGSLFEPDEVESERTVIISERQGHENEPLFRLGEAVMQTAFQEHPYRNEIIGSIDDLQRITRLDLYRHYRDYYHPGNAVLALAGDFDTAQMLESVRAHFEDIPPGEHKASNVVKEPDQGEERWVSVSGPGETTYLQISYRALDANHPDFWAFLVLDSLLSGPSNFNMSGGGISNKTSRLYRALVENEIAAGFSGGMLATIDPFLYTITITLRPDKTVEQALEAVDARIRELQDGLPDGAELLRAEKQARALFAYGSESISNQGFWLGFSEMLSDVSWFTGYLDRIKAVTPEDVQRAAQKYLLPERRTIGVYEPSGEALENEFEELEESE